MCCFDVLGEQQDAQIGVGGAKGGGGASAVVGVVGRHSDVTMARSGWWSPDGLHQGGGIRHPGHDVVLGIGEQAGKSFAEQGGVFGDHDAHGSTASMMVPAPRPLWIEKLPAVCADTVGQAGEAGSRTGDRASVAVVGDTDVQLAGDDGHVEGDGGRLGVLDGIGDCLGCDVVGGGLDALVEVGGARRAGRSAGGWCSTRWERAGTRPSSRQLGLMPCASCLSSLTAVPSSATASSKHSRDVDSASQIGAGPVSGPSQER